MGKHDINLILSINLGLDLSEIKCRMDKVADINFQCNTRLTALHTAVMQNNLEVVSMLLERGADMTLLPLSKSWKNEIECPLLMAFKQGESHEEMQLLLLRALSGMRRDKFDRVALSNIKRVTQYAMMYSTVRVFLEAKQMSSEALVLNSAGFNPLMFTIIRVGLFGEDVVKCVKILDKVLEIVDKDSSMSWERFGTDPIQKNSRSVYTGATGLGMMVFHVIADRKKRCTQYEQYVENRNRGKVMFSQNISPTDPHYDALIEHQMQRDAVQRSFYDKNLDILAYFGNEFVPCLFAKMLAPMRIALGMSTHRRLGIHDDCRVGNLNGDLMNFIFNELVRGLITFAAGYKHLLC